MKRVKNGRLFLIPASSETRGHLTTGNAAFYKKQLQELLQTAPQKARCEPGHCSERAMSSARFRRIALALPGAVEGAHQGTADFRVGKRIYATLGYPDDAWGMVKLTPEQQSMLVEAEPEIFRPVPGGWGKQGYTNVRLAKADATTLQSALTMAWENVAPKSRAKARDTSPGARQEEILISHRINPERPDRSLFERASAIGLRLELRPIRIRGRARPRATRATRRRIACEG